MTPQPAIATARQNRTVGRSWQSYVLLMGTSILLFGALGSRLIYLQLVNGNKNQQMADENRIRLLPRNPERGRVLDRHGEVLASSKLTHSLYVWPLALKEPGWPRTLQTLNRVLQLSPQTITERIERRKVESNYRIRILRNLKPQQIIALEEARRTLVGVEVDVDTVRYYPHGNLAAHTLGYTGEVTEEELKDLKKDGYRPGDVVGVMGIERVYEPQLRGQWGGQQVEVDAMGNIMRILGEKKARAGQDLKLTLDLDVQRAAEKALGDRKGAIVAMDPQDGSILALVSRPVFNPNWFSLGLSDAEWKRLQSLDTPFVNRALQGFPPASTFKMVTTTAGLESGKFSPETILPTFPYITIGGIQFWDWNRAGFGPLNFVGALAYSSDTFFYQVARRIGPEPIIHWSQQYGFGQKTGIELAAEESAGLVPSPQWKDKNLREGWYAGDTINMSIGQGLWQATPLQVAVMFAAAANGGYRVRPHLVADPQALGKRVKVPLKPKTLEMVQKGLLAVVDGGTASAIQDGNLPTVAGKTGTAEDPPRKSHTWFGGYAPASKPEIVVVSFNENSGGGGSSIAAPQVKQVLESYFRKKKGQHPKAARVDNQSTGSNSN
jgi:penicillin-binding protein 2